MNRRNGYHSSDRTICSSDAWDLSATAFLSYGFYIAFSQRGKEAYSPGTLKDVRRKY